MGIMWFAGAVYASHARVGHVGMFACTPTNQTAQVGSAEHVNLHACIQRRPRTLVLRWWVLTRCILKTVVRMHFSICIGTGGLILQLYCPAQAVTGHDCRHARVRYVAMLADKKNETFRYCAYFDYKTYWHALQVAMLKRDMSSAATQGSRHPAASLASGKNGAKLPLEHDGAQ
jgi:hypothetical protein